MSNIKKSLWGVPGTTPSGVLGQLHPETIEEYKRMYIGEWTAAKPKEVISLDGRFVMIVSGTAKAGPYEVLGSYTCHHGGIKYRLKDMETSSERRANQSCIYAILTDQQVQEHKDRKKQTICIKDLI